MSGGGQHEATDRSSAAAADLVELSDETRATEIVAQSILQLWQVAAAPQAIAILRRHRAAWSAARAARGAGGR
jgi:hypothetical protein